MILRQLFTYVSGTSGRYKALHQSWWSTVFPRARALPSTQRALIMGVLTATDNLLYRLVCPVVRENPRGRPLLAVDIRHFSEHRYFDLARTCSTGFLAMSSLHYSLWEEAEWLEKIYAHVFESAPSPDDFYQLIRSRLRSGDGPGDAFYFFYELVRSRAGARQEDVAKLGLNFAKFALDLQLCSKLGYVITDGLLLDGEAQ